jgi:hypothetical protein
MTAIMLLLRRLWASPTLRIVIVIFGTLLLVIISHVVAYRLGLSRGISREHAINVDRERAAVAAADAKYRAQEMANAKRVEDLRIEFAKRQAAELAVDSRAAGDLASGARRVRVAVTRCGPSPSAPGPAPARVDDTSSAELAPEVAAALYAIAADCDNTARELTALQGWATSAVKLCNGGASP